MSAGEVFAEISADALRRNYFALSSRIAPAKLIPVIKANAYGHGAAICAPILAQAGASCLAVARESEAAELLLLDLPCNILLLSPIVTPAAALLHHPKMIFTVTDLGSAQRLNALARRPLRVQIKLDAGMGRLGFRLSDPDIQGTIARVLALPRLLVEGFFTHLPSLDLPERDEMSRKMAESARALARELAPQLPIHIHASAGILRFGRGDDRLCRAGLSLYGYSPVAVSPLALTPVMKLYAPVLQVKRLLRGESVGYGERYIAPRDLRIAILGIGYGDGFLRAGEGAFLSVCGIRAEIVGRISMDMTAIALPAPLSLSPGDFVPLFGIDREALPRLAAHASTIPYEYLAGLTRRVERRLVDSAEV